MTARKKNGGKRKGAGRPAKADSKTKHVMIRLSPVEHAAVIAAAQLEGQPLADWGRAAFELALARGSTR